MKSRSLNAALLTGCMCIASTMGRCQTVYDIFQDYLTVTNPGPVWSYGWKPSLTGAFTPLTYHLVQPVTENSGWELWARQIGEPTSVYRNTGSETLTSDGGTGVYPPGSVWFGPGVEPSDDHFGVIRFVLPAGQAGRYRIEAAVQTRLDQGASDADFHLLHNGIELFASNIVPVSAAGYTNELNLGGNDTIDFICGRGDDGHEYGGGLKIAARISRIQPTPPTIAIRVSQVELCWDTETNQWYQVQYRSLLTTNQWVPLHPDFIAGTGSRRCTNDFVPADSPRRFYQVMTTTNPPAAFTARRNDKAK